MTTPYRGRKTRWGTENTAGRLINLATAITGPMTSEQIDAYVMQLTPFAGPPRPSLYTTPRADASTRATDVIESYLEDERHGLIERIMRVIPNYRAPLVDYHFNNVRRGQQQQQQPRRRLMMITDRVYIPARDFPEVNFIGQILGPRGRSIADLNARSGATIFIRGKGSVKEGRGSSRGIRSSRAHRAHGGQQEDCEGLLHCLITADSQDKIDRVKALVQAVIETAVTTPEHENKRKRQQLRNLAVANGTFRDDEGRGSGDSNDLICGAMPAAASDICRVGDNGGHIARDSPDTKAGCAPSWQNTPPAWRLTNANTTNQAAGDVVDLECSRFYSELGS